MLEMTGVRRKHLRRAIKTGLELVSGEIQEGLADKLGVHVVDSRGQLAPRQLLSDRLERSPQGVRVTNIGSDSVRLAAILLDLADYVIEALCSAGEQDHRISLSELERSGSALIKVKLARCRRATQDTGDTDQCQIQPQPQWRKMIEPSCLFAWYLLLVAACCCQFEIRNYQRNTLFMIAPEEGSR